MMPLIKASEAQFLFEISGKKLKVIDFIANERISFPFEVNLNLATEDEINLDDVISKEALLTILSEETDRYFHGIICQFMQTGSKGRFLLYQARIVPSLWLLSLEQDCRIFQNKNVQDIIQQVLEDAGIPSDRFEFRLQNQYQPMEYCVQYRETDLNFISRLLEEDGIFYFFEHAEDKHLLVFGDSPVNYQPIQGETTILYHPSEAMVPEKEVISTFTFSRRIHTGKYSMKDFNFEKPSLDLTAQEKSDTHQKLEIYDYPGEYMDEDSGKKLTQIRLQEVIMYKDRAEGQSGCARLIPCFTFSLDDHDCDEFNQEYLIVEVIHKGSQPQVLEELTGSNLGSSYSNDFLGIPSSITFRPERKIPKPIVKGLQTAIIVGPQGEEIYTDKYGRVKLQFHWDREGKKDEKSSCWVRVGQFWAGKGWGAVFIPRVGDEVLVNFLEGDPDKPIVTGSVYNEENKPLYTLPDEKTKSVIKSKSYPNDSGNNEIRFEDKKGEEQLFIHAQKDLSETSENNTSVSVGAGHSVSVGGNQSISVSKDRTLSVDGKLTETIKQDTKITISEGAYEHDVAASTAKYHVSGDLTENFDAKQKTTVGSDIVIESKASKVHITAATEIKLEVGSSKLLMKSDGSIELNGVNVAIKGSASVNISGATITSKADASHNISGATVLIDGSAVATIKGGMVMLNP